MEEEFENLTEEFLDAVFDYESKLDREVWEKIVADKCAWIFSPKKVRDKIFKAIGI